MWIDQRGSEILTLPECHRLLALAAKEDHIGRLAVNDGQTPLVVPLNFTFHDGNVRVLIGPGRMAEIVPDALVAFEVDRVEPDRGQAWSVSSVVWLRFRPPGRSCPGGPNPGSPNLVIWPCPSART